MQVQIHSCYPVSMTVNADDFGKLFAFMNSSEQVAVLRAMIDHMEAHPMQWDHIAIELEQPENAELRAEIAARFQYVTEASA